MSSAELSCSSRNNRRRSLTYPLPTGSERRRPAVLQSWVFLPELLVWTQAQPPARCWSRSGRFVVEEEECPPTDWSSEVEILCPKLSLLPRTWCSTGRDLRIVSGLWAAAPLKQSTAVPAASVKHLAPACLNTAWVLGPVWCCCLGPVARAAVTSCSTVNFGYGGTSARIGRCYSFSFVLWEVTCTCKGASSQSVSSTAFGFPQGDSEETSLDVFWLMYLFWDQPQSWSKLCVSRYYTNVHLIISFLLTGRDIQKNVSWTTTLELG